MKMKIERGRKVIDADESTPLRKGELAQFLGVGRAQISGDCAPDRGYAMEFGTLTRCRHYLEWLAAHPRRDGRGGVRQKREVEQRLEHELSRLR